jgi:class 3 adenylate cyclase
MSAPHPAGKALLRSLLADRNQYPDRVAEIDETIRRTFERRVAILVLDMSGFSRLTIEYGIIHYLAMIEQMDVASRPAVAGNRGLVIKQEADNLFAVFDDASDAVEAALDIFRAFDAVNAVVPESRDLYGSVGIGFGDTLVIGNEDLFGCEMNLASKLGEDLAERSEILLTPAAHAAIPSGRYDFQPRSYAVSGLTLDCFAFAGRAEGARTGQLRGPNAERD